ncbi:DUF47 family protein [Nocardioidaceae bacterium SCSIO 66511]|nr:DUF47 family protein [Nocardioidaceae bacterium SCSIO 66511]
MSAVRRLLSLTTGRIDGTLVSALSGQLHAAQEGADLALAMTSGALAAAEAREQMRLTEHRGDRERGRLVGGLSRALVTPMDREDLFRLSRSIDDVLDTLRDFVRESDLFGMGDQADLAPILDQIRAGLSALSDAVDDLLANPDRVAASALAAKKAGGGVRRLYEDEIARILADENGVLALRKHELARRLDDVGRQLSQAADSIADGAMKRWH